MLSVVYSRDALTLIQNEKVMSLLADRKQKSATIPFSKATLVNDLLFR